MCECESKCILVHSVGDSHTHSNCTSECRKKMCDREQYFFAVENIHPHRIALIWKYMHTSSSSQTVYNTHSHKNLHNTYTHGWLRWRWRLLALLLLLYICSFRSFVRSFARSSVCLFVCLILLLIFSSFTIYSILLKLLVARAHFLAPAISLNVVYECN